MTTTAASDNAQQLDQERADLLEGLTLHRFFLRNTLRGLTDEQAGARPTVSELCLGGLIKHVASTESAWAAFIVEGTSAMEPPSDESGYAAREREFRMLPGDTVESVLAAYDAVAVRTDELVRTLPDLDVSHPLPEAPWFQPGASWSARRVLLHIIAETSQHAGHADILREAIDGAKSMG
jgi:hypothetical protein